MSRVIDNGVHFHDFFMLWCWYVSRELLCFAEIMCRRRLLNV